MIKAKYEYRMAVQGARAERCTELEESEATYSEALSENAATLSLQCATLCWEHIEHMWELEACALRMENKSCRDFLIVHQAVLHQAPQTLKDDLHSSYSLLLGPSFSASQAGGRPLSIIPLKSEPNSLFPQKDDIRLLRHRWTHQWTRISPLSHKRNRRTLRQER